MYCYNITPTLRSTGPTRVCVKCLTCPCVWNVLRALLTSPGGRFSSHAHRLSRPHAPCDACRDACARVSQACPPLMRCSHSTSWYPVPPAYPGPWACRPWADNVSVARSVHGRSSVLRNVIRMNAASRPRGVVRHDKHTTPKYSIRHSRRASPAQAGREQSRMRVHQIPERVQTATQELTHQPLPRRPTQMPATWP